MRRCFLFRALGGSQTALKRILKKRRRRGRRKGIEVENRWKEKREHKSSWFSGVGGNLISFLFLFFFLFGFVWFCLVLFCLVLGRLSLISL